MFSEDVLSILKRLEAIITGTHVVYASRNHGSQYIDKERIFLHADLTSRICRLMALQLFDIRNEIDALVAPATGGVALLQSVGQHLLSMTSTDVLTLYCEKETKPIYKNETSQITHIFSSFSLNPGESLLLATGDYVFRSHYRSLIAGKKVLVIDDILTAGSTIRKVIKAVRLAGGDVVAAATICSQGGVTPENLGIDKLFSLLVLPTIDLWSPDNCPLCEQGVPINIDVGKGQEFIIARSSNHNF